MSPNEHLLPVWEGWGSGEDRAVSRFHLKAALQSEQKQLRRKRSEYMVKVLFVTQDLVIWDLESRIVTVHCCCNVGTTNLSQLKMKPSH